MGAETVTSSALRILLWKGSNVQVASGAGRETGCVRLPPQRSLNTSASTLQPVGSCPHAAMPTSSRGGVSSALWTVLSLFTLDTSRSLIAEAGGAGPRSPDSRLTFSFPFRPRTVVLSRAHSIPVFSPLLVVTNVSHTHIVLSSWVQFKDTCKID